MFVEVKVNMNIQKSSGSVTDSDNESKKMEESSPQQKNVRKKIVITRNNNSEDEGVNEKGDDSDEEKDLNASSSSFSVSSSLSVSYEMILKLIDERFDAKFREIKAQISEIDVRFSEIKSQISEADQSFQKQMKELIRDSKKMNQSNNAHNVNHPNSKTHHPSFETSRTNMSSMSSMPSSSNIASVSLPSNVQSMSYANFGTENYRYINMNVLCDIIKTISDMNAILQKVVKELYFKGSQKENNIIFISPNAYKTVTVFSDNAWRNLNQTFALEKIVRRANDVLQHYMIGSKSDEEIFKNEIGKKKFEALRQFTDRIDNMEDIPEFRDKLLQDTEHTIVTNQHLVHPHIYESGNPPSTF